MIDKKDVIKIIKKVKRRQRFDALNPKSLVMDRMFTTKQMVGAFDGYLDWLIREVEKLKDALNVSSEVKA